MSAGIDTTPFLTSALVVAILIAGSGCSWFRPPVPERVPIYHVASPRSMSLEAGAAKVDVTPQREVYLAGYFRTRFTQLVHDPIYARAVALESGDLELILVAVDVIGLQLGDLGGLRVALRERGLDPRNVSIAATHNHSGPDTLGMWGIPPFVSGRDPAYIERLEAGILQAIDIARERRVAAELAGTLVDFDPSGLIKNLRRPGLVDHQLGVVHVREKGAGSTIATLVEVSCHPEVLSFDSHQITADFPHWTVDGIEAELGGVGVYVSGAIGGLSTPDVRRDPARPVDNGDSAAAGLHTFDEAARIGTTIGRIAVAAVRTLSDYAPTPDIALWHSDLYIEVANWRYDLLRWFGLFQRRLFGSGFIRTEVSLWQLGDLRLAMVPGEITVDLGLRIRRACGATGPCLLVGLANDELGYLLPSWDFARPIYKYERTLCPSPEAGVLVLERLRDLGLVADPAQ